MGFPLKSACLRLLSFPERQPALLNRQLETECVDKYFLFKDFISSISPRILQLLGPSSLRYVLYESRRVVSLYIGCLSLEEITFFFQNWKRYRKSLETKQYLSTNSRQINRNSILEIVFITCKRKITPCFMKKRYSIEEALIFEPLCSNASVCVTVLRIIYKPKVTLSTIRNLF